MAETSSADTTRSSRNTAFLWLVVGVVIGLLVGVLFVPQRQSTVRVAGSNGAGTVQAGGSGTSSGGVGTAGSPAGGTAVASSALGGGTASGGLSATGGSGAAAGSTTAGGTGPSGATGGSGGAAAHTVSVPGVTGNVIRLGIAYPDISALKALGPAYDNGNVPAQWNALFSGYRQQHLLPVAGRDVQLFFASYNVLDASAQNTACRTLIEDDHVFAVIGHEYFETGSDCVARQFRIPLITNDGPNDDAAAAGAPYLISMGLTTGGTLRNLAYWALQTGRLNNQKIGVYYSTADPVSQHDAQANVIGTLQKLGHAPVATATTNDTQGGPEDAIAVEKFHAAGVTEVLPLASIGGFLQQADAQGYHPKYLTADYNFGTSDTATSNYQADQWSGTYGITEATEGASAGGKPFGPGTDDCVNNYNRQTGSHVTNPGTNGHESAEWAYIEGACDEGQILMTGLAKAGAALNAASLLAGIHTIANLPMRRVGVANFTGGRDQGADAQRTLQWQTSCTCYRAITDWAALYTT